MKIAYASSDEEQRTQFGEYAEKFFGDKQEGTEIRLFGSPAELLESVAENVYDVVFFDMSYEKRSGVEYVYRMRSFNPNVAVVVMKTTPAGRVECIVVNPALLILDDFSANSVGSLLRLVTNQISKTPERSILVRTLQNEDRVIPVTAIVYAESAKHKLAIHLTGGEVIDSALPMNQLIAQLKIHTEFLFPHRSFIVNAFYVSCITSDRLYLRSLAVTVPVARGKHKAVQEAYRLYFESYRRETNQYP